MIRLIFVFIFILTACTNGGRASRTADQVKTTIPGTLTVPFTISSPAFSQNSEIPIRYTCQGDDVSPAVDWSAPPAETKSLALIMDDPDAPAGTWVHWVVYNLPPDATGIPESASQGKSTSGNLPRSTIQGKNSFNRINYGGPCPPFGEHHYIFHLYALDTIIRGEALDKAALLKAMDGHILAQDELTGLYKKKSK
jgi:Raf kinase inhibitor-like YbhB/YbcL family protein